MRAILIICVFFLTIVGTRGQNNFYVAVNGSDANNGSLLSPWLSIQFGLNQLNENDTLNVLSGTYTEKLTIPISNIYLRNYLNALPVIDALGISIQGPIVSISNKSNVTIEGLELKNNIENNAQGILIEGSGSDITIMKCKIDNIHFSSNPNAAVNEETNAQAIIVFGTNASVPITNLVIRENEVTNCRLGYSEGIAVNGNVDGFEVSNNWVHDLTNIGIAIIGHEGTCSNASNDQARNGVARANLVHNCLSEYATSGGLYVDGGKNTILENNNSMRNGFGIEVGCEHVGKSAESIIVRNNTIYDNEICGIAIGGYDYPYGSGKVINSTITNNTCYYNDNSESGNGELYLSYSENSKIENNIFFTSDQDILAYAEFTQPSLVFDYNNFYCESGAGNLSVDWNGIEFISYSDFTSGTNTNANSIFADPQMISANILNPNFRILSTSPCVNAGDPAFVAGLNEVDLDYENRMDGIVDIGADEYNFTISVTEETALFDCLIFPNPASDYLFFSSNSVIAHYSIMDAMGRMLLIENVMSSNHKVNTMDWPDGLYFLRVKMRSGEVIVKKVVVGG